MTASWWPTAALTEGASLISVSTSGSPSPAGRRCSTVTWSPLSASACATPRPSIPVAPVTSTRTSPSVLRPTGPSTGQDALGPAGESLAVDLCGVPDVHRQGVDSQYSGQGYAGSCPYSARELGCRQPNGCGGSRYHHRHHLLSARRADADH